MNPSTSFNPRQILCPVDFSDLSALALKYAAAGARLYGAKLIVLHSELYELPRYFSRSETESLSREIVNAREMTKKDLTEHVSKILSKNTEGLDIEFEVTEVHPVEAILQTIEKRSVDLIVLGTHGLSGVKRLLLGSVAENVVNHARVPVFTVRQKEHEFIDVTRPDTVPRLEHILCACEISESDRATLEHAVSLAERFNARLSVLYSDESQGSADSSLTRENLCSWISGTVKTQCALEPVILKGGAADQIITYAKKEKVDLIVIGARHKIFHEAMILGKTTDLVVRHAPTPVLVIPGFQES
jgi:nucleotide-binding universal stress UspA family protein